MKIDWHKNEWFNKFYSEKISDEFKKYWIDYYGLPQDYEDQEEYWVRCAFFFAGWSSRDEKK